MLPLYLNVYNCVPNIVSRDIRAQRGALRLVDETFHEVPLALPAVGYHIIKSTMKAIMVLLIEDEHD